MSHPLLPGFNPDPSVVRVGDDYFLVTSSFEYLPGLPVHHSTDLRTWRQIGHVATRPEQVRLDRVPTPGGVWAPTLRYRNGVFHLIVTVFLGGRGCVVFTATDPAGPWSDGVTIPAVDGIDPDLAWDEDGTDRGHAVTVARAPRPEGPFESCPANPILTASGTGSPVQNVGHADLVETDRGTALVCLGVRPVGLAKSFSPLGRETFLGTVDWVDGWPTARLADLAPPSPEEIEYDFTTASALADPGWIAVRRPTAEFARPVSGGLLISSTGSTGLDGTHPAFLGRRQRHLAAAVSAAFDVSAGAGGLAVRNAEDNSIALEARAGAQGVEITARAVVAGFDRSWHATLPAGEVELTIAMTPPPADFSAGAVGGDRIRLTARSAGTEVTLAELDGRHWCFETAKAFTGRVIGPFASEGDVIVRRLRYSGRA
ncbi:family 43 glycosylhydrolase [Streptomyces sp. NPDC005070]